MDGEINEEANSLEPWGAHYEKLNKLDENAQYSELFPPNMLDSLKEMSDSAENILKWKEPLAMVLPTVYFGIFSCTIEFLVRIYVRLPDIIQDSSVNICSSETWIY